MDTVFIEIQEALAGTLRLLPSQEQAILLNLPADLGHSYRMAFLNMDLSKA